MAFTLMLRRRGWPVLYLGADVPVEPLGPAPRWGSGPPDVAVVAAHQLHTAARLVDAVHALARDGVAVAYAGRVFVGQLALRARVPAHYLGDALPAALDEAERTMRERPPAPSLAPPAPATVEVLARFRRHRARVEARVWAEIGEAIGPDLLDEALRRIGRDADAALELGDPALARLGEGPLLGLDAPDPGPTRRRILDAYRAAAAHEADGPLLEALAAIDAASTTS
jgi:hypothetical protein